MTTFSELPFLGRVAVMLALLLGIVGAFWAVVRAAERDAERSRRRSALTAGRARLAELEAAERDRQHEAARRIIERHDVPRRSEA